MRLTYLAHTHPMYIVHVSDGTFACNLINQFVFGRQVSRYATSPVADRICRDQMTDTSMTLLNEQEHPLKTTIFPSLGLASTIPK